MTTNLKSKESIQLVNPWSGAYPPDRIMTWAQIVAWCRDSVNPADQADWIRQARQAARNDDGDELGMMIIGA